jgi:glucoamylase
MKDYKNLLGKVLFLCALVGPSLAFSSIERETLLKRMLRNFSPVGSVPGAIIASPSKHAPDYYYHWVRDSSLIMNTILHEYKSSTDGEKDFYFNLILDNIDFNRRIQTVANPSGNLGEPRFNVDATASYVQWARPQNDGPALRAINFIRLAKIWMSEGREDLVRQKLYNASGHCVIKPDLEYISHHWRRTSFDLWEELHGHHLFTRLAEYRAMEEGGELALQLKDYDAGGWYLKQARHLKSELTRHWSEERGYLLSTINRDGGINYKASNLDSSVLVGVLEGNFPGTEFSLTDDRVLATAHALVEAFKTLYEINNNAGDSGVAIGRYPEDKYDGHDPHAQGNPWFINTATMAEFFYRVAGEWERRGEIRVTERNLPFLRSVGVDNLTLQEQHGKGGEVFSRIIRRLREKGDAFLATVKRYAGPEGSLSEQFNRTTGRMQGAPDLTWSYAAVISAIDARSGRRQ